MTQSLSEQTRILHLMLSNSMNIAERNLDMFNIKYKKTLLSFNENIAVIFVLLLGFKPRMVDSKSTVITTSLQENCCLGRRILEFLKRHIAQVHG